MRAKDLRVETRLAVTKRGSLRSEGSWSPCLIMDMSETGILLMSNREFPVGKIIDFKCELFPDQHLECKLEVRHVKDTEVGAKIVEIDSEGNRLVQLYLQELVAHKLDERDT